MRIGKGLSRRIKAMVSSARIHGSVIKNRGLKLYLRWSFIKADAAYRCLRNLKYYRVLTEEELKRTRRSDTVFIFGSGYSLSEISHDQWQHFQMHDTFGFTGFVYQKWIRVDYHLIRVAVESHNGAAVWRSFADEYMGILNNNSLFKDSIILIQGDYMGYFCNNLFGYRLLPPGTRIFRYKTANKGSKLPSYNLREGAAHTQGTLNDCVNLAFLMGWKNIVLVGVDLYDQRYFWLPPDRTWNLDDSGRSIATPVGARGGWYNEPHNTVRNGIVETLGEWSKEFEKRGVHLSVYNPRSLLAKVLPIYRLDDAKRDSVTPLALG